MDFRDVSVGLFSIEYNHIGKKEERRKKKEERRKLILRLM